MWGYGRMKNYKITLHYESFENVIVKAEDEDDAYNKMLDDENVNGCVINIEEVQPSD